MHSLHIRAGQRSGAGAATRCKLLGNVVQFVLFRSVASLCGVAPRPRGRSAEKDRLICKMKQY